MNFRAEVAANCKFKAVAAAAPWVGAYIVASTFTKFSHHFRATMMTVSVVTAVTLAMFMIIKANEATAIVVFVVADMFMVGSVADSSDHNMVAHAALVEMAILIAMEVALLIALEPVKATDMLTSQFLAWAAAAIMLSILALVGAAKSFAVAAQAKLKAS